MPAEAAKRHRIGRDSIRQLYHHFGEYNQSNNQTKAETPKRNLICDNSSMVKFNNPILHFEELVIKENQDPLKKKKNWATMNKLKNFKPRDSVRSIKNSKPISAIEKF